MKRACVLAAVLVSATARAECPTTPDDAVCRPWSAILLPTAFAQLYAPHGDGGRGSAAEGQRGSIDGVYAGGGLEAVLLAWSDNSEAYGPSQGRLRLDVAYLAGTARDAGGMAMYHVGAQVGFERNASRDRLIPFFAADLGGLWSDPTGRRWYVDAGVGVYLLHRRSLILDVEVTGVLPFRDVSTLAGVSARLGASFARW